MAPSRSYGAEAALSLEEAEAEAMAMSTEEGTGFLRNSGARGLLAEEEERLIKLRLTSEAKSKRLDAEVKKEIEQVIERARAEGEAEAKKSFERGSSLCATPYGIDIVGITEGIALVGALVGGIAAKSRKDEVQNLNEQLRTINVSLRKQARSGIVYAPDMNYAPPSGLITEEAIGDTANGQSATQQKEEDEGLSSLEDFESDFETDSSSDSSAAVTEQQDTTATTSSSNTEEKKKKTPSQIPESPDTASALKKGRKLLESKKGAAALVHFEKARMLSRSDGNKVQERRAERGLAAASRMQNQFKKAIGHLERVLEISQEIDEYTGDSDAYGNIADIYTELGDLEKAAKYYDLYIERMNE
jgi:tetratricopeptide (TPR) repeat protein